MNTWSRYEAFVYPMDGYVIVDGVLFKEKGYWIKSMTIGIRPEEAAYSDVIKYAKNRLEKELRERY